MACISHFPFPNYNPSHPILFHPFDENLVEHSCSYPHMLPSHVAWQFIIWYSAHQFFLGLISTVRIVALLRILHTFHNLMHPRNLTQFLICWLNEQSYLQLIMIYYERACQHCSCLFLIKEKIHLFSALLGPNKTQTQGVI